MKTRTFTLILTLFAVPAGCGRSDAPASRAPDAPGPAGVDGVRAGTDAMTPCRNDVDGYTIAYPDAWHVNADTTSHPCSYFDPEPLQIPVASEVPLDIAVTIGVDAVDFATASGEVMGRRDLSRAPLSIDGHAVVRIEGETTGEGLYDRGIRLYQYVVDLGDRTLIATTYDVGQPSFERKHDVLDAMMGSLDLHGRE